MKDKLKNKFLGVNELSDNKQKSLITLLVWFAFIGAIFAYVRVNNVNEVKDNNVFVFDSLEDIFNKYNNYKYDITIKNIDESTINYSGIVKDNIDNGSKKYLDEVINYKKENGIIINSDTLEEIDNLYDGYLSYFFTPDNIYKYISYLKDEEKIDKDIKKYSFEYIYEDKNITFEVVTTVKKIDHIEITYDDVKYNIKYSLME